MDDQKKLSTEEILKELENGNTVSADTVDFTKRGEQLTQLSNEITDKFGSHSKFATASEISPSHLNEFLNGKKQLHRDKLICICITLKYTISETRQLLHRLGNTDLYSRNRRDFEILNCIQQGKSLDETNEILLQNGLEELSDKGKQP